MALLVPELVNYYEAIESAVYEDSCQRYLHSVPVANSSSSSSSTSLQLKPLPSLPLLPHTYPTMFSHRRTSSQQSSTMTDSICASPIGSTFESPASLHSSPTFASTDSFKYQGASGPQRMNSLPPFSMVNMQNLMKSQERSKTQGSHVRKVPRPWFVRRALSQTDLDLESELRAEGIENMGLGMFEPRPRETTVSRQSTQGSVVLDGILEVMEGNQCR